MQDQAEELVKGGLSSLNAAELFFAEHAGRERRRGAIHAAFDEAAPALAHAAAKSVVLVVPAGPAGTRFRDLARPVLADVPLLAVVGGDDILFYREAAQVPLADLERSSARRSGRLRSTEAPRTLHAALANGYRIRSPFSRERSGSGCLTAPGTVAARHLNEWQLMDDYQVDLDSFRGPLDLLLYLVKRNEVDICDIPIARILEQFQHYLDIMTVLDVERVGDFIVMAGTLMEIKSKMVLPRSAEEAAEEEADPAKNWCGS